MSNKTILVINPNSTESMTRGIDAACEPLRIAGGPAIETATLKEGPPGIETQQHVDGLIAPLVSFVRKQEKEYDAFVIACYSDPGLQLCREGTTRPVFGIAECGVLTALARAERFGVIAIRQRSIGRHLRYLRQMGLVERFAGERPLEMSVAESAGSGTLERLIEVGRELKKDGAEAIILGCAGMARHRRPLEDALGVSVIDPTQAAVTMALGAVQLAR